MARVVRAALALALALALGLPASAAPERSPRPEPRPLPVSGASAGADAVRMASARPELAGQAMRATPRPRPRPEPVQVARAAGPALPEVTSASPIPPPRPKGFAARSAQGDAPAVVKAGLFGGLGQTRQPARGSVCGDRSIRGERIAAIKGRLPGCGIAEPVRVTEIDGIRLSQPAIMDCTTAAALKDWINIGARPAVGNKGGGLTALKIAAHYSCRTRNNKPGAKISEHGKGRAIDIAGLILRDGAQITVLQGWEQRGEGRILRAAHGAACGPFGTVLGPQADRYHKDHFHFDTARHRSGAYCR